MVLWGKLAENQPATQLKVVLSLWMGELRTRRFEKNGQMNYVTEVLVTGFQLLKVVPNVPCVKIMQDKI